MTEYERKLINAAKRRILELRDDPDELTVADSMEVSAAIVAVADESHVVELLSEAAAKDPCKARIGIAAAFRGIQDSIDTALLDQIGAQLQPFKDAAIEELRTSTAASDLREMVAQDRAKRQRDLACEAPRAGL